MDISISEENILGNSEDCYFGGIYPKAHLGLSLLRDFPRDRPIEIYLCIRSYAPFIASLYAQSLRHGAFRPWAQVGAANEKIEMGWNSLTSAIRDSAPDARIIIWRYEDFRRVEDEVLGGLSGLPPHKLYKPAGGDVLPSASGRAIAEMMAAAPELSHIERVYKMLALTAQYPRDQYPDKFAPWTDDQAAELGAAYERDVNALRQRSDVTFLG